jgi:Hypervirulence associated proteins TUDOR domain
MAKEFKKGDKVAWESSQGEITGEVEKKLTSPTEIKKHHVAASKENPEYLVKSEKTGKEAAHKPESLKEVKE